MIGYALLVLVAFITTLLGSIVVGVAIWGWKQEKKAEVAKVAEAAKAAALANS